MDGRTWSVGELARLGGLTVRTLHHYDEVGLLTPSERTYAGHRRYAAAEVRRLYRILALRRLGLSLEEVGGLLAPGGPPLRDTVAQHLERVERELERSRELRGRLQRLLAAFGDAEEPSTEELIDTIEVMTMHEQYYTPEQREQLARRAAELGEDGMLRAQEDWAETIAAMRAAMDRGADPGSPEVQAVLARWSGLIEQFAGGDPGIRASLKRMYENEDLETASRGALDAELKAYVDRANAARDAAA